MSWAGFHSSLLVWDSDKSAPSDGAGLWFGLIKADTLKLDKATTVHINPNASLGSESFLVVS